MKRRVSLIVAYEVLNYLALRDRSSFLRLTGFKLDFLLKSFDRMFEFFGLVADILNFSLTLTSMTVSL